MARTKRRTPIWAANQYNVYQLNWSEFHGRFVDSWERVKKGQALPIDIRSNKFIQGRDGINRGRDRTHNNRFKRRKWWHKIRTQFRSKPQEDWGD